MQTLTISGDNIPAEIAPYARIENGQLVIDAGGAEIPPLQIDRSNVTIKNVRIQTNGQHRHQRRQQHHHQRFRNHRWNPGYPS